MPDPDIVTTLRLAGGLDARLHCAAADEIELLRKQRDEARRFMCCFQVMKTTVPKPMSFDAGEAREYAKAKGWHCFEQSEEVQKLTPKADSADTP